jgi:immunity protein 74 of polymorphic toxin system
MTPKYRLESMSRGQLIISDGRRRITVEGEVLPFAKPGDTSYVLYSKSIQTWATATGNETVTPEEKSNIIDFVAEWARENTITMEIE